MVEFLTQPYMLLLEAILAFIGAFYVPGLRFLATAALKALFSEVVIKRLFLELAQVLVKSTKTLVDDVWLEQTKQRLK